MHWIEGRTHCPKGRITMNRRANRIRLLNLFAALVLFGVACAPATAPAPTAPPTSQPAPTPAPPTATPLPPTPAPKVEFSPHGYHAAAYDSKLDRMIVFGGQLDGNHVLSDTWTYDMARNMWAKMSPAQSPGLLEGPTVYDSAADRTILFVGNRYLDPNLKDLPGLLLGVDKASETWAYDDNTNTWTDLKTAGGPSGLLGARMVYDAQSDRIILLGASKCHSRNPTRLSTITKPGPTIFTQTRGRTCTPRPARRAETIFRWPTMPGLIVGSCGVGKM
jgi:hypothetical protein